MDEIRFIKDFSWKGQLMAKGRENGRTPLFVRQGDLDGACAVYSLMMMLMIHRKINRRELEDRKAAQKKPREDITRICVCRISFCQV